MPGEFKSTNAQRAKDEPGPMLRADRFRRLPESSPIPLRIYVRSRSEIGDNSGRWRLACFGRVPSRPFTESSPIPLRVYVRSRSGIGDNSGRWRLAWFGREPSRRLPESSPIPLRVYARSRSGIGDNSARWSWACFEWVPSRRFPESSPIPLRVSAPRHVRPQLGQLALIAAGENGEAAPGLGVEILVVDVE